MIIYKNGIPIYECTDPVELKALIESIANDLSLNYYVKSEVMNLIASARSVVQVDTMPQNPTRSTLYYVGTQAPYQVILVDSNGTVVDMGSSEVDLSGYLQKSAVINSLDFSVTMEQVPSAYAVTRYSAQSPFSLINLTGCADLIAVIKRITKMDSSSSTNFRNYATSSWVTAFPADLKVPNLDDYGTLQFVGCYRNNAGTENILGELRFRPSGSSVWYRTTPSAVNWKPVQNDAFAPLQSAYNKRDTNYIAADDAVWDLPETPVSGYYYSEKKIFANGRYVEPITASNARATIETVIAVYYAESVNAVAQITQTAIVISWGGSEQIVSRRTGKLTYDATNVHDVTKVNTYKSAIVWKNWYPVEYPVTQLTLNPNIFSGTPYVAYSVSGGNMVIEFFGLRKLEGLEQAVAICELPILPLKTLPIPTVSNDQYFSGTIANISNGGAGQVQIYKAGTSNRMALYVNLKTLVYGDRYDGSIVVPLGY